MAASYEADSIQVLEGLEAVRVRPGMYVGDVHDGSGLHHLIWEVVGNVIDLHLAGKATRLALHLDDAGWVEVHDDGPGFPVELEPRRGVSALEAIFTTLHAGATRDGHFPHVHLTSSFLGVGLGPVCALSAELEVETRTRGQVFRQRFERGVAVSGLERVGRSQTTGSRVRFRPDAEIFSSTTFDRAAVRERLHQLAYLNPMLTVQMDEAIYRERDGLAALVWAEAEARGADPSLPILRGTAERDGVRADVALAWTEDGAPTLRGFVNQVFTRDGGTHVEGFWEGLRRYLRLPAVEALSESVFREVFGRGLVAAVHVGLYDPRFGAPTGDRLASPEGRVAASDVVFRCVQHRLGHDAPLRRALLSRLD